MLGWIRTNWRLAAACVAALLAASPAPAAQRELVGRVIAVCVKPVARGDTAAMVLARLDVAARRFDCATRQTRFGSGDFWVLSAPLGALPPDRAVEVRTASLWQERMTLYVLRADGTVTAQPSDDRALSRRIQIGAIVQHRIAPHGAPAVRLLWRIDGAANLRGIVLGARVASVETAAGANLRMAALYAGFAGLCLALIVHNLAMWCALRLRFQLAYVAMLVALLGYAVSSSGALAQLWPGLGNTDRIRINYVLLAASSAAAMTFARHFFEDRIFAGWLGRATRAIGWGMIGSALAFAALAPWRIALLDGLYSISFVAMIGIIVPILWRAWRLRSGHRWLFALAWALPIALAAIRVLHNIAPLPWSFWLDNSTLLAMTAEALLSSLAITYRVRLLALERDQARAQEIATRVLADTDPLTGLLNRRAFLSRAIGRSEPQALLLLDIDHFKRVNDTLGHDGGDEVLRLIARVLRESAAGGLAARLGGEEFAILTPIAAAPDSDALLARLRTTRMPFDLTVTASIGCCTATLATEADWKAAYRAADCALYEAKAAGRDRVRVSRGSPALAA